MVNLIFQHMPTVQKTMFRKMFTPLRICMLTVCLIHNYSVHANDQLPEPEGTVIVVLQDGKQSRPVDPTPRIAMNAIKDKNNEVVEGSVEAILAYQEPVRDVAPPKLQRAALEKQLRSGCNFPETSGIIKQPSAVVDLGDFMFPIKTRAQAPWLPDYPKNPNNNVNGIDADGDCVRDDIEYYIASRFPKPYQKLLRKYLFQYVSWLNFSLHPRLSEKSAELSAISVIKSASCVNKILRNEKQAETILDDLFKKTLNTNPRAERYIKNLGLLAGWTTREDFTSSCR